MTLAILDGILDRLETNGEAICARTTPTFQPLAHDGL